MPKEIEVTLRLKLKVEDQEEADYYLDAATNEPAVSFIADVFDEFEDSFTAPLVSVNGRTKDQIAQALQAEIT
jgi:hypothetical protein